jgi:hypothetical protein
MKYCRNHIPNVKPLADALNPHHGETAPPYLMKRNLELGEGDE